MLAHFKSWLRSLSPGQAAIFYIWIVAGCVLAFLHGFSSSDIPDDIDEFPVFIMWLIGVSSLAKFFIWLCDIRLESEESNERVRLLNLRALKDWFSCFVTICFQWTKRIGIWWWILATINIGLYIRMIWNDHFSSFTYLREELFNYPTTPEVLHRAFANDFVTGLEQLSYELAGVLGALIFSIAPGLLASVIYLFRKQFYTALTWFLTIVGFWMAGLGVMLWIESLPK